MIVLNKASCIAGPARSLLVLAVRHGRELGEQRAVTLSEPTCRSA